MAAIQQFGPLVGRILLALIFIMAGLSKIGDFAGTAQYMQSAGLPMVSLLLVLTIVVELGAGLLIALGWKARWGAGLLFLFVIPVTVVFHDFWTFSGPEMQAQMQHFLKNMAIMGGMLLIMARGPGPYSLGDD